MIETPAPRPPKPSPLLHRVFMAPMRLLVHASLNPTLGADAELKATLQSIEQSAEIPDAVFNGWLRARLEEGYAPLDGPRVVVVEGKAYLYALVVHEEMLAKNDEITLKRQLAAQERMQSAGGPRVAPAFGGGPRLAR